MNVLLRVYITYQLLLLLHVLAFNRLNPAYLIPARKCTFVLIKCGTNVRMIGIHLQLS